MPICLDICLMGERYDAGDGEDPRSPEWPPHPARVFSAMRSVSRTGDLPLLYKFERLSPPLIHATTLAPHSRSRTYVVTNALEKKGGNQTYPGRKSDLKERVSTFPADPRVQFFWPGDEALSDEEIAGIDDIARRIPYLGRSSSPVIAAFRRVPEITPIPGLEIFEPTDREHEDFALRVPFPGFLDELNALYDGNQPSWQASRSRARQSYRMQRPVADVSPASSLASAYPDLIILRFIDQKPPGNLIGRFTAALRSKVMSDTKNPLPPALHGHGIDGQPHIAYLGLPFAGFEHADGHLVALAVAIPGLDPAERRRILRGILGDEPDRIVELRVPGIKHVFELRHSPHEPLPRSATANRWLGPSRRWVSVTPLVLDTYPKDGDLLSAVKRSFRQAGFPEPLGLELSKQPLTNGAVKLTPLELPRRAHGRLYRHVRATFEQPVTGPVLVGAGRYFGVGLFAPETGRARE